MIQFKINENSLVDPVKDQEKSENIFKNFD